MAPRKEDDVAEIQIERTQRSLLPWLIGLVLVALLVIGLVLVFADSGGAVEDNAPEVGRAQEKKRDETPRRLQQWALVMEAGQAGPASAA